MRTPIEPAPLVSLGNPPLGPTVLDMASAFGTLANDGVHCPAHAILSVRDRDGRPLPRPDEVVLALQSDHVPRRHPADRLASRAAELRAAGPGWLLRRGGRRTWCARPPRR